MFYPHFSIPSTFICLVLKQISLNSVCPRSHHDAKFNFLFHHTASSCLDQIDINTAECIPSSKLFASEIIYANSCNGNQSLIFDVWQMYSGFNSASHWPKYRNKLSSPGSHSRERTSMNLSTVGPLFLNIWLMRGPIQFSHWLSLPTLGFYPFLNCSVY